MGKCAIDHSLDSVHKKLESQKVFLTEELYVELKSILNGFTQENLNELFHLLKKYDLLKEDDQELRNKQIKS